MKVIIIMKTPGIEDQVGDQVAEKYLVQLDDDDAELNDEQEEACAEEIQEVIDGLKKYFKHSETVKLEYDTETKELVALKNT